MEAIYSPNTLKAYFKKHNKLYEAPYDVETKVIDFTQVSMVDWFFLTTDEMEDAFMVLDIMEERDEIRE